MSQPMCSATAVRCSLTSRQREIIAKQLDHLVAELKSELKQRHLTVSGTKSDLIERLRAYQELHTTAGTGVVTGTPITTTSSSLPRAGGVAEPGARGVGGGALSNPTPPSPGAESRQQGQIHLSPAATQSADWSDAGSSTTPSNQASTPPPPQQDMTFGCLNPSSPVSPSPHAGSPSAMSPENHYTTSINGLDEMAKSPPMQLSLLPHTPATTIKAEPTSSLPMAYSTQKPFVYSPIDSTAVFSPPSNTMAAASITTSTTTSTSNTTSSGGSTYSMMGNGGTVLPCEDRDKMLRDKDRQIKMLTRMLNQKQQLVELLRMQLEQGNRGGRLGGGGGGAKIPDTKVLIQIKKEPGETSPFCLSADHQPLGSGFSYATPLNVTVKQESMAEIDITEMHLPLCPAGLSLPAFTNPGPGGPPARSGNPADGHEQQIQQAALQLAQQRAIQKLLLQEQNEQNQQNLLHNPSQQNQLHLLQNPGQQNQQNIQQHSQQRKKKSHKQQLKQQQQQQLLCQMQPQQQQQSQPKQSQAQLKQQVLLRQQQSVMLQKCKLQHQQQPTQQEVPQHRHQSPIQAKVQLKTQQLLHAKQQQLPMQQTPKRENQGSQLLLNQQTGSATSFNLDYLKTVVAPALLTDGNGNHFLVALTNHVSEIQKTGTTDSMATTQIMLKGLQSTPLLPGQSSPQPDCPNNLGSLKESNRKVDDIILSENNDRYAEAGPQVTTDQSQQGNIHSLSSFIDNETLGKDALLPSVKTEEEEEAFSVLDHSSLFSPLSPASLRTPASSPGYRENTDDLFDILFQTGEISSSFKPSLDPSLDGLHTSPPLPSPPPSPPPFSPLQLVLSPPTTSPPPFNHLNFPHAINKVLSYLNTQQHPTLCPQEEPRQASDTTPINSTITIKEETVVEEEEEEEKRGAFHSGGHLEDFLESTTGTPPLGVEPGSPLTLIDDLQSQLLSFSSILDRPTSPMDTLDLHGCLADHHPAPPCLGGAGEQIVDVMEWLDLTMGTGEELSEDMLPTHLAPLAPPMPVSVFCTDFLNVSDLQMGWDSCL
ncbi:MKL/myocardin-like protein 1 [Merluccius polli]|uniref:MKL/myocardin-like protein 1 n=1 Tax=Merluccius polli TaxID=89951 RepID=A0AA47N5D0_MERPO|nr:MKL/myocardin-like protein 1 [Merluccius polli]